MSVLQCPEFICLSLAPGYCIRPGRRAIAYARPRVAISHPVIPLPHIPPTNTGLSYIASVHAQYATRHYKSKKPRESCDPHGLPNIPGYVICNTTKLRRSWFQSRTGCDTADCAPHTRSPSRSRNTAYGVLHCCTCRASIPCRSP